MLQVGAILGAEAHSMILVFNTDEVLAKFTSGKRELEFGQTGLMGDLSFEGSSFKKLDVE